MRDPRCHDHESDHDHRCAARRPASPPAVETDREPTIALSAPCDCRHVELSSARRGAITRASDFSKTGKHIEQFTAAAGAVPLPPAVYLAARHELFEPPAPSLFWSAILGSVLLRC
jgi:hypothetical protein